VACRTVGTKFHHSDFAEAMSLAGRDDLVYCDPPYCDSQTILYGAQSFSLERLLDSIAGCKSRGARVALSIDGTKFSGHKLCDVPVPDGLFVREEIHHGRPLDAGNGFKWTDGRWRRTRSRPSIVDILTC